MLTRPTEPRRTYRRASNFSTGLHGRNWVDSLIFFQEEVEKLISFSPHKRVNYQQGLRAASLFYDAIRSSQRTTPLYAHRATANRVYHYEKMDLPRGLVALGDSVCALCPYYGQGWDICHC